MGKALQKISQADLAAELGMSRSMLSHVVVGRKPIPDRLLLYLGYERVQRIEKL